MQSRFAKALLYVAFCGVFVLLLIALVEGPAPSPPPPPKAPIESAALWPGSQGFQELLGDSQWPQRVQRSHAPPAEPAGFQAPAFLPCRDANGRVLRTAGYVRCAFVIFDPQAAAG